jgi:hypothetical protein
MNINAQIARQLQDVYFGGNWTDVNLKDSLEGIDWEEATTKVQDFNTIAALVYHMNFYVRVAIQVLHGEVPDSRDTDSFAHPPIASHANWQEFLDRTWSEVNKLAGLVEQMPEQKLWETFMREKYGNYYRNLTGIVEHVHYHLGQVVLIKKIIWQNTGRS